MNSAKQSDASESRGSDRYERVSSRTKTEAVLRLLKGEPVETLSEEVGVTIARLERWKSRFVGAGSAELAARKNSSSQGWAARHSRSIWQWTWLLLTLIAVISILAVFMQRGTQE